MERFGVALKRRRLAAGMRQEDLGDASGIDRTYINKLERGRVAYPEETTIERLAQAFGITVEELLSTVEPPAVIREDRDLYFVDPDDDELLAVYDRLSEPDRKRLRAIARALWILDAEE